MDLESLARRLEAVERQNRLLRRVGCGALGVIAGAVLWRQVVPPGQLDVTRLRILDAGGRQRAILGIGEQDTGIGLGLYDAEGKARLGIVLAHSGPRVFLADKEGKVQLGI